MLLDLFFTKYNKIWTSWELFETFEFLSFQFGLSTIIGVQLAKYLADLYCNSQQWNFKLVSIFLQRNHIFAARKVTKEVKFSVTKQILSQTRKLTIWAIWSYGNEVMGNEVMGIHLIIWICIEKFEPLIRSNEKMKKIWTVHM